MKNLLAYRKDDKKKIMKEINKSLREIGADDPDDDFPEELSGEEE